MDPVSVIVLALIYAALRAPGEAGRAVRSDYRNRRGRWSARAEPWMTGRGRGGRRVAGYDRGGRPYSRRDYRGRGGRGGGGPAGWWRDPQAWRGREGRARVARRVRPSAIRAGIVAGALGYTAVFGLGVAARGFARGLRGGYRMGRAHYRGQRNLRHGPTVTVTPGQPGAPADPDTEVVDAVIIDEDVSDAAPEADDASPGGEDAAHGIVHALLPDDGRDAWVGPGWVITVVDTRKHVGPGEDDFEVVDRITVTDPADLRRRMADIAATPYLWGFPRDLRDTPTARHTDTGSGSQNATTAPITPTPTSAPENTPTTADMRTGPWLLTVHGPGINRWTGGDSDGIAVYDPADLDRRLNLIASIPGLGAQVKPLPEPEQPEDPRPNSARPTTADPADPQDATPERSYAMFDERHEYEQRMPDGRYIGIAKAGGGQVGRAYDGDWCWSVWTEGQGVIAEGGWAQAGYDPSTAIHAGAPRTHAQMADIALAFVADDDATDADDFEHGDGSGERTGWRCPECGEPAIEGEPDRWPGAWGEPPAFTHLDGEPLCPIVGDRGYEPAQPEPDTDDGDQDDAVPEPRPTPAGFTAGPEHEGEPMSLPAARDGAQAGPPAPVVAQYVPIGDGPVGASMLMEGANYDAHLHNLGFLLKQAQREYSAAELTVASAAATRKRAENDIAAAEQMAAALTAQDFGSEHVGNMATLHELLTVQVAAARAAHQAAFESMAANEHVIEVCMAAEAAFRRDHGQLAEAHATAPHAAKTREAYQD